MNKQSEAQARYDAAHTVRIGLKLNTETDADIIRYLEGKNKQGIIKEALRKQMRVDEMLPPSGNFEQF